MSERCQAQRCDGIGLPGLLCILLCFFATCSMIDEVHRDVRRISCPVDTTQTTVLHPTEIAGEAADGRDDAVQEPTGGVSAETRPATPTEETTASYNGRETP